MKIIMRAALAALALAVSACATDPATIAVTPQSAESLIVFTVEPAPVVSELDLRSYDAEKGRMITDGSGSSADIFTPLASTRSYVVTTAKPGRYVVQQYSQQQAWSLCFHQNSLYFDVNPGEVVFAGLFDPKLHIVQLQSLVVESRQTYLQSGEKRVYFDHILPPQLAQGTEADLPGVRDYLAMTSPLVTAPVRVARLEKASFSTGATALLGERLCWSGDAKGVKE